MVRPTLVTRTVKGRQTVSAYAKPTYALFQKIMTWAGVRRGSRFSVEGTAPWSPRRAVIDTYTAHYLYIVITVISFIFSTSLFPQQNHVQCQFKLRALIAGNVYRSIVIALCMTEVIIRASIRINYQAGTALGYCALLGGTSKAEW